MEGNEMQGGMGMGGDDDGEGGDNLGGDDGVEQEPPVMVDPPFAPRKGLPYRAVIRIIGLLRKAANKRRASEQELLKVGAILAKNGFVGQGKHRPRHFIKF